MKKYIMTFIDRIDIDRIDRVVVECTEKEYQNTCGTIIQSNIACHIVGTHRDGWTWFDRPHLWSKEEINNEPSEKEQKILDFFKSIDVRI